MSLNVYEKSLIHQNASAVAYEALTFTGGYYTPTVAKVFAGLYISPAVTTAYTIVIEGVDGITRELSVIGGLWPLGGQRIVEAGTSADLAPEVTVLF